jgi:hypothetical protein
LEGSQELEDAPELHAIRRRIYLAYRSVFQHYFRIPSRAIQRRTCD